MSEPTAAEEREMIAEFLERRAWYCQREANLARDQGQRHLQEKYHGMWINFMEAVKAIRDGAHTREEEG